jgi:hypothetical protein
MLPEYQAYYHQLLATLALHTDAGRPESKKVEACFKSSLECWGKVRKEVKRHDFDNTADEIRFFKEVKPLFTSYIEYYTYCYHALLFMPAGDLPELKRFWKWEMRKIERFREKNREFCEYIRQGDTYKDNEYFLRSSNTIRGARPLQSLVHDLDADITTSHDYLVTMIGAYDLYEKHIQAEIEKPGGTIFFCK